MYLSFVKSPLHIYCKLHWLITHSSLWSGLCSLLVCTAASVTTGINEDSLPDMGPGCAMSAPVLQMV